MIRILVASVVAVAAIAVYPIIRLVAPNADMLGVVIFGAATTSFALVGLMLVVRAPGNRIGPVLLLVGALLAFAFGCDIYGSAGANADPDWSGSAVASVLGEALFVYPIALALIGIPLIFPDGHLISRRWQTFVWLVVAALATGTVGVLIGPGTATEGVPNPVAVPGMEGVSEFLGAFASATSLIGFGAAAAAVWVRFRRGDPTERQQLKWLLAVAALAAVFFPVAFIAPVQEIGNVAFVLGSLTLVALPLAIAVAILRYRLFEIDRLVSRTIAYGIVSAALVATYAVVILLLQGPMGALLGGDTISVALSTLVVAALFQPLRSRVKVVVDRRFDRARFDADRTTAAFSERLRDQVDIAAVTADLDRTVGDALKPAMIGLWLRNAERTTR